MGVEGAVVVVLVKELHDRGGDGGDRGRGGGKLGREEGGEWESEGEREVDEEME